MITEIRLSLGASRGQPPLKFEPGAVTVFVGPNNSGKSLVLRELGAALFDPPHPSMGPHWELYIPPDKRRIVREVSVPKPDWSQIRHHFERVDETGGTYMGSLLADESRHPGYGHITPVAVFIKEIENQSQTHSTEQARLRIEQAREMVRRRQVEMLDGQRRLSLIDPRPMGNLKRAPTNLLQALFRDDARRHRLRELTNDAFELHLVIDPTAEGRLSVAMSREPPRSAGEERSLSEAAIQFFKRAIPIAEMSDGVKAYTGILAAMLSSDLKVLLIDEPDAFLHPPLAHRLGRILTSLASERDGNLIASTHDAHFLMGCVQAGKAINIVRLTYQRGAATARLLLADRLRELMRDPLLRSTRVLEALFHQGAVVCEADPDRVFYEEINGRLLGANRTAASDCLFMNAQNKQTVRRIVQPLREMGIPAAAIVDLDVLQKGNHDDLRDLMKAASVPDGLIKGYGQTRGEVEAAFTARTLAPKREGIYALDRPSRETAESLLSHLAEYGIFVVPVGELERWLSHLGVSSAAKHDWLPSVFDKMGSDPAAEGFLKPGDDDVWRFIGQVARWIADPARKGMPE